MIDGLASVFGRGEYLDGWIFWYVTSGCCWDSCVWYWFDVWWGSLCLTIPTSCCSFWFCFDFFEFFLSTDAYWGWCCWECFIIPEDGVISGDVELLTTTPTSKLWLIISGYGLICGLDWSRVLLSVVCVDLLVQSAEEAQYDATALIL